MRIKWNYVHTMQFTAVPVRYDTEYHSKALTHTHCFEANKQTKKGNKYNRIRAELTVNETSNGLKFTTTMGSTINAPLSFPHVIRLCSVLPSLLACHRFRLGLWLLWKHFFFGSFSEKNFCHLSTFYAINNDDSAVQMRQLLAFRPNSRFWLGISSTIFMCVCSLFVPLFLDLIPISQPL